MPGAVAMQQSRAHGGCSCLCVQRAFPARAASRSRLPKSHASTCQAPSQLPCQRHLPTERHIAAAHPLLLPLPLSPLPTVATQKQRQQHGELSTYTLAGTVGIGVCLLCDEPLGTRGRRDGEGGHGNIPPIVRQRKGRG